MQLHKCANVGDEFTGITITFDDDVTHVYADFDSLDDLTDEDWYETGAWLKWFMLELKSMFKKNIDNINIDIFKSGMRACSFTFKVHNTLTDFMKHSDYYKFFEDLVYFSLITSEFFDNLNIYSLLTDNWYYDLTNIEVYKPTESDSSENSVNAYVLLANTNDNAMVLYRNQFHREIYKGRLLRTPDKIYIISDNLLTCINKVQPTVPKTSTLRMLTLREIIEMDDDII